MSAPLTRRHENGVGCSWEREPRRGRHVTGCAKPVEQEDPDTGRDQEVLPHPPAGGESASVRCCARRCPCGPLAATMSRRVELPARAARGRRPLPCDRPREVVMDRLFERCAGIDVHQRTVVVCRLTRDAQGARLAETQMFGTTTSDLWRLCDWLPLRLATSAAGWPRAGARTWDWRAAGRFGSPSSLCSKAPARSGCATPRTARPCRAARPTAKMPNGSPSFWRMASGVRAASRRAPSAPPARAQRAPSARPARAARPDPLAHHLRP